MRALFAVALLLFPFRAMALPVQGTAFNPNDTGINAALLSSAPATTLRVRNFNALTFYIQSTWGAASALTMNCNAGTIASGMSSPVAVANVGPTGLITMADGAWTYPTGGVSRWYRMMVAPLNDTLVTCTFGGTGATTDTISVYAYAGAN